MQSKRKTQATVRCKKQAEAVGSQLPANSRSSASTAQSVNSMDPTIWEYTLGRQISEARSACLQGLRRIPTGLGRLAYMAILQHRLLEDHEELFGEWRYCSLQQKREWLNRLLASASRRGELPEQWLSTSPYSELVPRSAKKISRKHYLEDIEAVLEVLREELAELPNESDPTNASSQDSSSAVANPR